MAQSNRIDVTIFPREALPEMTDEGLDAVPLEFSDVNYISFVSDETYGIPAVIAEDKYKDEGLPLTVLYVFPANVVAMEAVRKA
jgi:hypothetical protein